MVIYFASVFLLSYLVGSFNFAYLVARIKNIDIKKHNLSLFLIDMRSHVGKSIFIKPIKTMINHSSTEIFIDNLEVDADCLVGEEGKGF